jgi:hypothetical protein
MAEHWIQKAVKHKGALHRELGVPAGKNIPKKTLAKAASAGGTLGKRARLAETLSHLHHSAQASNQAMIDHVQGRSLK